MYSQTIDVLKASSSYLTGLGEVGVRYGNLFLIMNETAPPGINDAPPIPVMTMRYEYLDLMKLRIQRRAAPNETEEFRCTRMPTGPKGETELNLSEFQMRDRLANTDWVSAKNGLKFKRGSAARSVLVEVRYVFNPETYPQQVSLSKTQFTQISDGDHEIFPVTFALFPRTYWDPPEDTV